MEVWSEKGTIRGVLKPVLDHYAVGFRVMHGFTSATALTPDQTAGLPSFPASDKRKDPRYPWFVDRHGTRCWEIDAMDPRDLRECAERAIKELIEPVAWARCETVNAAELESLQTILSSWNCRP